tara:strand:- start:19 stop:144 length:126 start_codon:yes stop_codon:yes gene_type:complete
MDEVNYQQTEIKKPLEERWGFWVLFLLVVFMILGLSILAIF